VCGIVSNCLHRLQFSFSIHTPASVRSLAFLPLLLPPLLFPSLSLVLLFACMGLFFIACLVRRCRCCLFSSPVPCTLLFSPHTGGCGVCLLFPSCLPVLLVADRHVRYSILSFSHRLTLPPACQRTCLITIFMHLYSSRRSRQPSRQTSPLSRDNVVTPLTVRISHASPTHYNLSYVVTKRVMRRRHTTDGVDIGVAML